MARPPGACASGPRWTIAAREREAVGLAHGRAADDLDVPEAEVALHAADHRELLVVLLAEHRDVGPRGEEELGDDGCDTAEVTGSRRAAERLA